MRRLSLLICGALLLLPPRVSATQSGSEVSPEALLFEEIPVVVSATRTERSLADVPNALTVITAEEIRDSGATSLEEALQLVPGLDVMRISNSDVNMSARGFNNENSSQLLVMIDGRSAYLDFFGIVLWESLNVTMEDIERIEVVRGPGSALYGANAFLGTVNIITKKARDLPTFYSQVGVGPEGGFVSTTTSQSLGRAAVKASARYRQRDYFRNTANSAPNIDHDRHHTDFRTQLFRGSFEYDFDDDSSLRLSGGSVDSKAQIYTAIGSFDYQGPEYYAELDWQGGPWRLQAFYTRLDSDLDAVPTGLDPAIPVPLRDRLVSETVDLELQREIEWRQHHLLVGWNARRISTDAPSILGSRESDALYAMFLQDEYRLSDRVTAFLGVRADEHPRSGLNLSPRAGLVVKVREADRLRLSFARSFRNPTQIQNYSAIELQGLVGPGPPVTLVELRGNEDLDPSFVTAYELGYQTSLLPRLSARVDLFYNVLEDFREVAPLAAGPPAVVGFDNDGRTRAYGGELTLEFRANDMLRGFGTYSYQAAHGPNQGAMPRHKGSIGIRGRLGPRLRYALSGLAVGYTDFDSGDVFPLPEDKIHSRFALDVFLGFQVTPQFELGLKGRNVLHQVRRQHPVGDEIGSELLVTGTVQF
jgi:iron complex outermembrane receptor protein